MIQTEDVENDLLIFRDDMYAHYKGIYQDFSMAAHATAPDIANISGNAAFLTLMQVFLNQIDETIPQVGNTANFWQNAENPEAVAQSFLKNIFSTTRETATDTKFRSHALETALQETNRINEDLFYASFDAVFSWLDMAIKNALDIIHEHKDNMQTGPANDEQNNPSAP